MIAPDDSNVDGLKTILWAIVLGFTDTAAKFKDKVLLSRFMYTCYNTHNYWLSCDE